METEIAGQILCFSEKVILASRINNNIYVANH